MESESLPDASLTLLTGATGALGQEVLCQWLENQPVQARLLVLARGKGKGGAKKRIDTILHKRFSGPALAHARQQVTVLNGDMSEARLGLEARLYQEVVERTAQVIHCAAAVRFDQPIEEARQSNLEGTRQVLQLAKAARRAGQAGRLDYVSTAYIAGKRQGVIYEGDYSHNKGFHNSYEQSKYEAEGLVRQAQNEIPIAVYRPSIIIGNSRTGETSNFKAFYWPVRAFAMGQLRFLPGVSSCQIDLVPVDYVAAGITYLARQEQAIGGCYHLTCGRDNLIALSQIVEAAADFFKMKPSRFVHPAFLKLLTGWPGRHLLEQRLVKTLKLGAPYFPYFATKMEYDTQQAQAILQPQGISAPHVSDFFDNLFRYCLETNWGKQTQPASDKQTECTEADPKLVGSIPL